MGEFASKGVAGTGLGLGIAGTALGVLAGSNGGNGGLLGGLFGNGCADKVSALMAENAMLKSENYSDKVAKDVYGQSLTDNRRLRDEMYAFIKPLSDEAASNRERVAVLEAQVAKDGEIGKLREELVRSQLGARIDECCCKANAKIDAVAAAATCGISQNSAAITSLQNLVSGITRTIIPRTAICPEVMERWNSWVAPTATAPAVQPVTGTIDVQKG